MRGSFFCALLLSLFWNPNLNAQTPFYQGRTIKIVVGGGTGGATDLYARVIASYMPKYIPGNPNIIVQNMPGAASMIAANYTYEVAKPDGLTIASIFPALYFDQLIGRAEVKFDWTQFTWIGTPTSENHLFYMRADTPHKTVDDIRKAAERPRCGTTGTTSTSYYMPKLFEEVIGLKLNLVTGYRAATEIDLAVERGEVQCRSMTINTFFVREPFLTWRKTGFVRVLIQTGKKRDARLSDVPTIYELMDRYKTPEASRRLAAVILAAGDFGWPYVGPPGMRPDHVKMLREAFMKTMNDAEFSSDARKKKLELDPSSGEVLEALAKEVIAQPPQVIERMRKLLGE